MNKNQKKIVILLPFFRDGGVERAMINLAQGLLDAGEQITFLFMTNANGPLRKELPAGSSVIELKKSTLMGAVIGTMRYLRKGRPDVLLSVLTPANIVAVMAKKLSGIKVKTIVSVQVSVQTPLSTTALKAKLRPLFYKLFYGQADAIVAASKGVAEDLKAFTVPSSKITVIYNPVVSKNIEERSMERVEHPWFNSETPLLLAAGRLHKQKDFPTLLRAFTLVLQKEKAHLMILGEGEDRDSLEALARALDIDKEVAFIGFVQNPYSYMKNASLFVLSSGWEGFGNVVAEALAVGTPVVSTDCPWGPAEILDNGNYGRLVPVGDIQMLAEAIEKSLAEKTDSALLTARAAQFSIPVITEQYMAIMQIK